MAPLRFETRPDATGVRGTVSLTANCARQALQDCLFELETARRGVLRDRAATFAPADSEAALVRVTLVGTQCRLQFTAAFAALPAAQRYRLLGDWRNGLLTLIEAQRAVNDPEINRGT